MKLSPITLPVQPKTLTSFLWVDAFYSTKCRPLFIFLFYASRCCEAFFDPPVIINHHDSSNLLAESQVLFLSLEEACAGLAAVLQLLHGLQQRLVLHLQLQEAAGGQLIDLMAQRLLRNCRENTNEAKKIFNNSV